MSDTRSFLDSVVVITGASSGIGEALAREFFVRGARVALLGRRLDQLERVSKSLDPSGTRVKSLSCDVRDDQQVSASLGAVRSAWGQIDVVVANAGFSVSGRLDELSASDFQRQFETNVFGLVSTARHSIPDLKKSRGRLVLVGSVAGYLALPNSSAYASSKAAVTSLAKSWSLELKGAGVSLTLLTPGFVDSQIRRLDAQGRFNEQARDPVPGWLVMPTQVAARQAVDAIAARKNELVITWHGKVLLVLQKWIPAILAKFMGDNPRAKLAASAKLAAKDS